MKEDQQVQITREKFEENPTINETMTYWNANSSVWDSYYETKKSRF